MSELNTGYIRPNRIATEATDPGLAANYLSSDLTVIGGDTTQLFAGGITQPSQGNSLDDDNPHMLADGAGLTNNILTFGFPDLNIPIGSIITRFEYILSGLTTTPDNSSILYTVQPPKVTVLGAEGSNAISFVNLNEQFVSDTTSIGTIIELANQNRISSYYGPGSPIFEANPSAYYITQDLVGDINKVFLTFRFNDLLLNGNFKTFFLGSDTGFDDTTLGITTDQFGAAAPNNPTPSIKVYYLPPFDTPRVVITGGTKVKIGSDDIAETAGAITPVNATIASSANNVENVNVLTAGDSSNPNYASFLSPPTTAEDPGYPQITLSGFNFSIPSNATINQIQVTIRAHRESVPGSSSTRLGYEFTAPGSETYNRYSSLFFHSSFFGNPIYSNLNDTYGEGSEVLPTFINPSFINNLVLKISWTNAIIDDFTGNSGGTNNANTSGVRILGSPFGFGGSQKPRIIIKYSLLGTKCKVTLS